MKKKIKTNKNRLYLYVNSSIMNFITDLECNREMFNVVLPELKEKDNERKNAIKKTLKPLRAKNIRNLTEKEILKFNKVIDDLNKLFRARQAFEKNAIVMLVSRYDEFLAEILRLIYRSNSRILKSSNKVLTYEEVLSLNSAGKTLNRIINKEVDELLYQSHLDQLKYLDKKFKINVTNIIDCTEHFIEATERRNLFVHCGGRISEHYLVVCKKNGIPLPRKLKEGLQLGVGEKYFEKTYKCLFEIGIVLGQYLSRISFKDKKQLDCFDRALVDISYNLLKREEWDLADKLLSSTLKIPKDLIADNDSYKIFIINKCIALKNMASTNSMNALLATVDWSKGDKTFLLATEVLKENYDKAESLMMQVGTKILKEQDFKDWPLFKEFRKTNNFKRAFRKIYKKNYKPELKEVIGNLSEKKN